MRIKTSNKVHEMLPEMTRILKFSSKAETLRLAIGFAFSKFEPSELNNLKIDMSGFEIDTHILFGEEGEYYETVIKYYFNVNEISAYEICSLIELGMNELSGVLKRNKNDIGKIIKYIMEV